MAVRTHDFADADLGKVTPYGVYDLAANTGWVNVGTGHDTAAFAVESIRRWWTSIGAQTYPAACRLLITCDAGGSNGYRTRAWKAELAAFAEQTGLQVTVAHFPPGTSKFNKIEHRLFCHITMNWRGLPLTSHEVVVNRIAATTTSTGLTVAAELDTGAYPEGVKIGDKQMQALPLDRHAWARRLELHPAPRRLRPHRRHPGPIRHPQPRPGLARAPRDHRHARGRPCRTGRQASDPAPRPTRRPAPPAARIPPPPQGRRRGHRPPTHPHPAGSAAGRDVHYRLGLPQTAVAALFGVAAETINRRIRDLRRLLEQDGATLQPAQTRLRTLDDHHRYTEQAGITNPTEIKAAC